MTVLIWKNLKITFMFHIFLEILQKYCKLVYISYFGHVWLRIPKVIPSTCRKLLFIGRQKINFIVYVFLETQIYFGYFGKAWIRTLKMMALTCRKLWCSSVLQKQTSSFTSFLRYYILKIPALWLHDSILSHNLRIRNLPDMRLVIKYQWQYHLSF